MAYVERHRSKWRIVWRDERGRLRRKSTMCETKKKAQDMADDLEREAERVRMGLQRSRPVPVTFAQTVGKYLPSIADMRSYKHVESRIRLHVLPALGDKLLTEIVPADIKSLLAAKVGELAPQTREHLRVHIQAVFTFAIRDQKTFQGVNPASEVPKVFIPDHDPKALPAEWIPGVFAVMETEHRDLVATALYTGMRKGELLGQRKEHVHLERRLIEVHGSYGQGRTKGGKSRPVPIFPELVPYLEHALGSSTGPMLFPDADGEMRKPAFKAHDIFKRALVRAGHVAYWAHVCRRRGCGARVLPKLPAGQEHPRCEVCTRRGCGHCERHDDKAARRCPTCNMKLWVKGIPPPYSFKDLRSTFATLTYERTGDMRFVQELVGHHDIQFTADKYARFRAEHLQEQAAKVTFGKGKP